LIRRLTTRFPKHKKLGTAQILNHTVHGIMTTIVYNLQAVRTAIAKAAVCAGRSSDEVTLLAVSKTFSHDTIREAYLAGQTNFAENYVQEASRLEKEAKALGKKAENAPKSSSLSAGKKKPVMPLSEHEAALHFHPPFFSHEKG
jgi:hypothetical protein